MKNLRLFDFVKGKHAIYEIYSSAFNCVFRQRKAFEDENVYKTVLFKFTVHSFLTCGLNIFNRKLESLSSRDRFDILFRKET